MSTTSASTPSTTSPSPSSTLLSPDSCISLASNLRCFYSLNEVGINHTLLIIPVALEIIFTTSLIFTNRRSGRRHLFLVAQGFLDFLLALLEVLSFRMPAVRFNISHFKVIDKAIGALSFTPLFFFMLFLYVWVLSECLPITPTRVQRIARLLLFMLIPAVITVNMIASFVGVSYSQGTNHVIVNFGNLKENGTFIIWLFFSSITLALFTLFQASCFCFAFCRLVRAVLTQRGIETTSKDAAVLFRGIGWMNGGILLGTIETVVGFVFYGIPIAYVRRVLRLLSLALLSIGVAKGIDGVEDFGAIRHELEKSSFPDQKFRRSKLRELIANPRLSTFRQLSPTATAFHARPRAPFTASQDSAKALDRHPYAKGSLSSEKASSDALTLPYAPLSLTGGQNTIVSNASPRPSLRNGLPGMSEFARVKQKRMSEQPRKRVTIYYNHGTPTLHLRLESLDLSSPAGITEIKNRPMGKAPEAYRKFLLPTSVKERSRFSSTSESSVDPDTISTYPASTAHRHTAKSGVVSTSGANSYEPYPTGSSSSTTAKDGHTRVGSNKDIPSTLPYPHPMRRFSGISNASGLSAAQAEIVDAPRRQLSFRGAKSALARAVLYPAPGKNVALALTGDENEQAAPPPASKRKLPSIPNPPATSVPSSDQQPSQIPAVPIQYPTPPPTALSRPPQNWRSLANENGTVGVRPIPPFVEEASESGEKHHARKTSGHSTRSIRDTLQAVREMADKFPALPPAAIGVTDRMENDTLRPRHQRQRPLTAGSTDTEEFYRTRIPAEKKMKGRAVSISRPPITSDQEIQQLPPALPQPNALRETQQSVQQQLPPPLPPQFTTRPTDPFPNSNDDDRRTSLSGASELSALSMSIKLRHPRSLESTVDVRSTIGSPAMPVPDSDGADIIDFGTALKEWRMGSGPRGTRATGDLSSIVGSSHKTRNGQAPNPGKRYSVTTSDILDGIPEQLERSRQSEGTVGSIPGNGQGRLPRITSVGNAPRRVRPQPVKGHTTPGSLYLQPLVIPS